MALTLASVVTAKFSVNVTLPGLRLMLDKTHKLSQLDFVNLPVSDNDTLYGLHCAEARGMLS